MKFKPLHDRILVQRTEALEKTESGLFVPQTAQEAPAEGTVISVGTGRILQDGRTLPLDVKAGDTVLFGKYSGSEITVEGENLLILREDEVLGILTE